MDNESEVIQRQMEATRASIQDKLETLEHQVTTTVQNATGAVGDTVESVKYAVQDTVETVKDAVQDTVQTVKESFDIVQHVQDHPWTMFLGATALGFVATRWVMRVDADGPPKGIDSGAKGETLPVSDLTPRDKSPGVTGRIADHYRDELAQVKALAVGTLGALIRDAILSVAPPALADHIGEVANNLTHSMGGHVIAKSILESAIRQPDDSEKSERDRRPAETETSFQTAGF